MTRFALRGSPADFDGWERLGNPGWDFETILPSFRRLERDLEFGGRAWHGDAGPIPVTRYPDIARTPVHQAIVDAAEDLGFPRVEDHNEPGVIGIGPIPMSSVDGVRVTTTAYLDDLSTKPVILPDSPVAEVAFDGMRATGVRLLDGRTIDAGLVVLSAGTYGSPLILMRSGVGPADHLHDMGVPVRIDLPGVGANLGDHPSTDIDLGYAGALA